MQLDSHRRQLSLDTATVTQSIPPTTSKMPCRWSRRCGSSEQETTVTNEDGVKMQSWHSVRRYNMRKLRKNTRHIVLLMALIEAMRVGPVQMVYAGKQGYPAPGPEDFGVWNSEQYI